MSRSGTPTEAENKSPPLEVKKEVKLEERDTEEKKEDDKKAVPDNDAVSALMALASTAEKDDSGSNTNSAVGEEESSNQPPAEKTEVKRENTNTSTSTSTSTALSNVSSNTRFPSKLMAILSTDEYKHIVSWSVDGKSFLFHDRKGFETVVLPSIFKDSKFDSFLRKLYRWGFSKCQVYSKVGCPAYKHEKFFRGHPELCAQMECRSKPKSQPRGGPAVMALNSWHASMQGGSFPMSGMHMGMNMGMNMGMMGMGMNMGGNMNPYTNAQGDFLSSLKNGTLATHQPSPGMGGMLRPDLLMQHAHMNMSAMAGPGPGGLPREGTSAGAGAAASDSLSQYISKRRVQHQQIMNSAAQVFHQQGATAGAGVRTGVPGDPGPAGANGNSNSNGGSGSNMSAQQQALFQMNGGSNGNGNAGRGHPNPASAMLGLNRPGGQFSPSQFPAMAQMRAMRLFQLEQEIAHEQAQHHALNQAIDHNQMRRMN